MKEAGKVRPIAGKLETAFFIGPPATWKNTAIFTTKYPILHLAMNSCAGTTENTGGMFPTWVWGPQPDFVPGWKPVVERNVGEKILPAARGWKGPG